VTGTDAVKILDGERRNEILLFRWRDDSQPVRLVHVGGNLGYKFIGTDPGRGGEARLLVDFLTDAVGQQYSGGTPLFGIGHVEVRLVQGQRLNERGVLAQHRSYAGGFFAIHLHPRRHEDEVGTLPLCFYRGLGKVHAVGPGLVTDRLHDAPRRRAPDGDRLPGVLVGIVALLDRRVERIHVYLDDAAYLIFSPARAYDAGQPLKPGRILPPPHPPNDQDANGWTSPPRMRLAPEG